MIINPENTNGTASPLALAALVAPEDIRPGDFVTPMNEIHQFPMRACESPWSSEEHSSRIQVVRVRMTAEYPRVLRVLSVALPFALVEDPEGCRQLLTVRIHDLARLPEELGRIAMRDLDKRRRKEARMVDKRRRARRDSAGRPGAEGAD